MFDLAPESGWDRRRSTLLGRYEVVALELFAKRGYREITVDDIAASAGVSARTLFRYFPSKEDFLLGLPRRGIANLTGTISALEPSDDPVRTVWDAVRRHSLAEQPDVRLLELWRRAATDAPEIHARVRGERVHALADAVVEYCARSLGVDEGRQTSVRLVAGVISGIEMAAMEAWGRGPLGLSQILEEAEALLAHLVD
ncbi:MAG: TetR family transcriptional regulator [Acidobacteriota bacterium]|nr:TetR family transcriptional regulator [Acidobacteriota bacterium]